MATTAFNNNLKNVKCTSISIFLEKQRDLNEYLNLVFEVMGKNKLIVFGNLHPA